MPLCKEKGPATKVLLLDPSFFKDMCLSRVIPPLFGKEGRGEIFPE